VQLGGELVAREALEPDRVLPRSDGRCGPGDEDISPFARVEAVHERQASVPARRDLADPLELATGAGVVFSQRLASTQAACGQAGDGAPRAAGGRLRAGAGRLTGHA
jgi:hypothetical protein